MKENGGSTNTNSNLMVQGEESFKSPTKQGKATSTLESNKHNKKRKKQGCVSTH